MRRTQSVRADLVLRAPLNHGFDGLNQPVDQRLEDAPPPRRFDPPRLPVPWPGDRRPGQRAGVCLHFRGPGAARGDRDRSGARARATHPVRAPARAQDRQRDSRAGGLRAGPLSAVGVGLSLRHRDLGTPCRPGRGSPPPALGAHSAFPARRLADRRPGHRIRARSAVRVERAARLSLPAAAAALLGVLLHEPRIGDRRSPGGGDHHRRRPGRPQRERCWAGAARGPRAGRSRHDGASRGGRPGDQPRGGRSRGNPPFGRDDRPRPDQSGTSRADADEIRVPRHDEP